jgi:hypothetical protein
MMQEEELKVLRILTIIYYLEMVEAVAQEDLKMMIKVKVL